MGRRKELDIAKSQVSDVLSYQPGKSPGVSGVQMDSSVGLVGF